jgi:hypothetical protein
MFSLMFSPVGDCEVGAAKKACKNCTCGRAEAEEKVGKLELTAEQINNPQSACGSVSIAYRWHLCPLVKFHTFTRTRLPITSGDICK